MRTPLVLGVQGEFGADAHHGFDVSRSLRWALGRLLRKAAAVAACSSFALDELAASFELRAPAVVIPNGVTPEEFQLPRPEPNGLGRYLFAAGRLVDQKGLNVLLRAYAAARPALDGRRLVIAGDGPLRTELEQLADELGLNGSVSFLGSVGRPRLASLLRGADAFAFPSRHEAFGIALLEAMAAGTPAVAAASGGIPELAGGGQALLVAPEDAGQLADALVRIVHDEPLRQRLVLAGRAQAEDLSWSRLAQRYLALYREVCGG